MTKIDYNYIITKSLCKYFICYKSIINKIIFEYFTCYKFSITTSIRLLSYSLQSYYYHNHCCILSCIVRSSRPEVFYNKGVLRNFAKVTEVHLCQSLFFNKVAGLRLQLYKKETLAQVFSQLEYAVNQSDIVSSIIFRNNCFVSNLKFELSESLKFNLINWLVLT